MSSREVERTVLMPLVEKTFAYSSPLISTEHEYSVGYHDFLKNS